MATQTTNPHPEAAVVHAHKWRPENGLNPGDERCECGAFRCHAGKGPKRCTQAAVSIWNFCEDHGIVKNHIQVERQRYRRENV